MAVSKPSRLGTNPFHAGPTSFHNFLDEGQIARALAYGLPGNEISPKKMHKVAAAFFKRQGNYLLTQGFHTTFARWVKVLVWKRRREELTARDALLTCYDYLDGVKPPAPLSE